MEFDFSFHVELVLQLQTNERENSATLTTSDGELRLFAYDCPDVSTITLYHPLCILSFTYKLYLIQ